MCELYVPTKGRGNEFAALGLGGLCVLAVFSLLPLLHALPGMFKPVTEITPSVVPDNPPDAFVEPDPPPPVEPEPLDKPKIEPPPYQMTIEMMGLLLDPGDNATKISTGWSDLPQTATSTGEEFLWKDVEKKPKVLIAVRPIYPYSLKGESGEVVVEFIIDSNGNARNPTIRKSTHWEFEKAAIEAVLKSKWQPGMVDNKAVDTRVQLPVRFSK